MGLPNRPNRPNKLDGSTTSNGGSESVKVVVRSRPLSHMEIEQGHTSIVSMDTARGVVEVHNPKEPHLPAKCFTFDAIYDQHSKQADLYDETFRELVDSVLLGFNGTLLAYGQTGTGKTFTMEGVKGSAELRGVIPNAIEHIFRHIAQSEGQEYLVRASYLEIYQEEIRDLLDRDARKRLELKERPDIGVYVKDLSSFVTKSIDEIQHVMSVGHANRSVGQTNMNEHSSRSHAIFIITVECSELGPDGESHIRVGRLNLVDLAGSERQTKTGTHGEAFKEATKINLSLSALGNVISALVDAKNTHVPYRDSKLTRLLQDSLGGNSKTIMCANIGPATYNFEETLSTLRYANRAKAIQNRPKINEDPKDALLREFQDEIARLKQLLEKRAGSGHRRSGGAPESAPESGEELLQLAQQRLEAERDAVLRDREMLEEQRARVLRQLEERAAELTKERAAQAAVAAKIGAMQSKLLSGDGISILSQTQQQQQLLQLRRMELAEHKRREREMAQQLEAQEDGAAEIRQTFANLQQEVEAKTRKLQKFLGRLQQIRAETRDVAEANSRERQALEDSVSEMNKELKLKWLLIENFIPAEVAERIKACAHFNEDEERWVIPPARATQEGRKSRESSALSDSSSLVATSGRSRAAPNGACIMASTSGQSQQQQEEMADSGLGTSDVSSTSQESSSKSPASARLKQLKRPVSMAGLRRPMCNYERQQLSRLRQRSLRAVNSPAPAAPNKKAPACHVSEEVARFCCENLLTFDSLITYPSQLIGEDEEDAPAKPAPQSVVVDVSRIPVPRSRSGSAARRRDSSSQPASKVKPSKNGQARNVHGNGNATTPEQAPSPAPAAASARPPSAGSLHFPKARGLVGGGAAMGRRQ